MNLKVGDVVIPCDEAEAKKLANWNPQGDLKVISIRIGKRSRETIVTAVDERGVRYYSLDIAFKKVSTVGGV